MATIYYQINKKSGIKYAYSSEAYWDPEKKAPRSRNTFLGRVDEKTGEIIPKKSRRTSVPETDKESVTERDQDPISRDESVQSMREELQKKDGQIEALKNECEKLRQQNEKLLKALKEVKGILTGLEEEGRGDANAFVIAREKGNPGAIADSAGEGKGSLPGPEAGDPVG